MPKKDHVLVPNINCRSASFPRCLYFGTDIFDNVLQQREITFFLYMGGKVQNLKIKYCLEHCFIKVKYLPAYYPI